MLEQKIWKQVKKVALSTRIFSAMRDNHDDACRKIFAVGRVRPSAKKSVMLGLSHVPSAMHRSLQFHMAPQLFRGHDICFLCICSSCRVTCVASERHASFQMPLSYANNARHALGYACLRLPGHAGCVRQHQEFTADKKVDSDPRLYGRAFVIFANKQGAACRFRPPMEAAHTLLMTIAGWDGFA